MNNIFVDGNIVDPDGDPLTITAVNAPPLGTVNMPAVATEFELWDGASDTKITLHPNGDYILDLGSAKTNRYGPQVVFIRIDYTDGKAADHQPDGSADITNLQVDFAFVGDLSENQPPPDVPGNKVTITV